MKRTLLFALSLLSLVACSKFDDSEIWSELKEHEDRIVKLETLCNQMNTNITSLQTIIIALQNNDYVTNIAPIKEGSEEIGYTITFAKSGSITIYHGKDGENGKDGQNGTNGTDGKDGQDGKDGKDGKDGYTPKIGVKQHTDGQYYWTLDGSWLLDDNGNMIPTTGEDGRDGANGADGKDGVNGTNGKDGQDGKDGEDGQDGASGIDGKDGKDGVTPQLKIEDGYWYLSYDNGATWQKLGKATGNNGLDGANGADGEDGDSIIDSITQDDENVYFNLSDGTLITLPKQNIDTIIFEDLQVKAICCRNWDTNYDGELSYSEASSVKDIETIFKGNTYISSFPELEYFTSLTSIPSNAFRGCSNLWKVKLPTSITTIGEYAFSETGLYAIKIPNYVEKISGYSFHCARSLKFVEFGNKLTSIGTQAFYDCSLTNINFPSTLKSIGQSAFYSNDMTEITIPENVIDLGNSIFGGCSNLTHVYCLPTTPPTIDLYGGYTCEVFGYPSKAICIIYVPETSLETYKAADGWDEYKTRIFANK